jgi:hypothetical protein
MAAFTQWSQRRENPFAARMGGLSEAQNEPAQVPGAGLLNGANLDDFGNVMPKHVLDAHLQGRGRAGAA